MVPPSSSTHPYTSNAINAQCMHSTQHTQPSLAALLLLLLQLHYVSYICLHGLICPGGAWG